MQRRKCQKEKGRSRRIHRKKRGREGEQAAARGSKEGGRQRFCEMRREEGDE